MHRYHENRDREHRFDGDTDWGQPRSRNGHGKVRRLRHEPYRRQSNGSRRFWFEESDDTD